MPYTTIETKNAKYILVFGTHVSQSNAVFNNADAVVLEAGSANADYKYVREGVTNEENEYQYRDIIRQAKQNGTTIWAVDGATKALLENLLIGAEVGAAISLGANGLSKVLEGRKRKMTRRQALARMGQAAVGFSLPLAIVGQIPLVLKNGQMKHEQPLDLLTKYTEAVSPSRSVILRNTISAEKTEAFVAPKLARELGRKPVIGMVWGAAHYQVKNLLLHPERRRKILEATDLDKTMTFYKDALEIKTRGGKLEFIEHKGILKNQFRPRAHPTVQNRQTQIAALSRREFMAKMLGRKRA